MLKRIRWVGASAIVAISVASCADLLSPGDVDGYDSFCKQLSRCFSEDQFSCDELKPEFKILDNSPEWRERFLSRFEVDKCASSCSGARRCLDNPPFCKGVGADCGSEKECCGSSRGLAECGERGNCCVANGSKCEDNGECCDNNCEQVSENVHACGGFLCLDEGESCKTDSECCLGVCDGGSCSLNPPACVELGQTCTVGDLCCAPDGPVPCPAIGGETGICFPEALCIEDGQSCGLSELECCSGTLCERVFDGFACLSCLPEGEICDESGLSCCEGLTCFAAGIGTAEGTGAKTCQACNGVGVPCDGSPNGGCCAGCVDGVCAETCKPDGDPCVSGQACCSDYCEGGFCGQRGCSFIACSSPCLPPLGGAPKGSLMMGEGMPCGEDDLVEEISNEYFNCGCEWESYCVAEYIVRGGSCPE